ncbi:GntR family transcriptional regulator [candidate division KSB1 bacterium]|nr:GntR family transcriptional regulator [candidate division KSB1 bacterium]
MDLEHIELTDRIYSRVKKMIFDQELLPGQKLLQEKLSAQLGVSRTPLLKALHRLESEMLVESKPRRGLFVKQMSVEEIIDIFHVRAVIEGLSARLAAAHVQNEHITFLRQLFQPFRDQHPIDYTEYEKADRQFHNSIMLYSGNKIIARLEMLSNLHLQAFQAGLLRPPEETIDEHFNIIKALAAGDGQQAEQFMRNHIDKSREALQNA